MLVHLSKERESLHKGDHIADTSKYRASKQNEIMTLLSHDCL